MKRFNVSILAVVAVLAIGLTAFTKAEPAGKRISIPNCYRSLVANFDQDCVVDPFTLQPGVGILCATAKAQELKGLTTPNPSGFFASLECSETSTYFCCAQLVVDETPCETQPNLNFIDVSGTSRIGRPAEILKVWCKPTNN